MPADPFESVVRSPQLLDRHRSTLLIVDVQEKLLPVIDQAEPLTESIVFLLDVAAAMNVPVVVSEQYPRGLGPTISQISEHSVPKRVFEKLRFSAAEGYLQPEPPSGSNGRQSDRDQVVIVGIEAHVCVLQTALDLQAQGRRVFVVQDAVGSRHADDRSTAMDRVRDAGGTVCSAESVAFEWCEAAGTDEFRLVSRLVRDRDAKRR